MFRVLGIYYNFDPNAHFIALVGDQNPNNGNILVLSLQFKKITDKVASFFRNGTKKSKNFGDLGLGFWSQIDVMKREKFVNDKSYILYYYRTQFKNIMRLLKMTLYMLLLQN